MREPVINQAIDSTTWTAIAMGNSQKCGSYLAKSRDADIAIKIKRSLSDATFLTIDAGGAFGIRESHGVPGSVLFYAQSVSGTPIIEVVIGE